jgi:hypothetical protein
MGFHASLSSIGAHIVGLLSFEVEKIRLVGTRTDSSPAVHSIPEFSRGPT